MSIAQVGLMEERTAIKRFKFLFFVWAIIELRTYIWNVEISVVYLLYCAVLIPVPSEMLSILRIGLSGRLHWKDGIARNLVYGLINFCFYFCIATVKRVDSCLAL